MPGIEPGPPGWKPGILATRPHGSSFMCLHMMSIMLILYKFEVDIMWVLKIWKYIQLHDMDCTDDLLNYVKIWLIFHSKRLMIMPIFSFFPLKIQWKHCCCFLFCFCCFHLIFFKIIIFFSICKKKVFWNCDGYLFFLLFRKKENPIYMSEKWPCDLGLDLCFSECYSNFDCKL